MTRPQGDGLTDGERYEQGMTVRREVLSNEHVDRATASVTELTADFQDFITRVAWGDVWSRPGLERRMRSVAVLTSLIAHGHHEELAMHLRAALRNGLTVIRNPREDTHEQIKVIIKTPSGASMLS